MALAPCFIYPLCIFQSRCIFFVLPPDQLNNNPMLGSEPVSWLGLSFIASLFASVILFEYEFPSTDDSNFRNEKMAMKFYELTKKLERTIK